MKRLSLSEQRRLIGTMPVKHRMALQKHCTACEMQGQGLGDILKSIGQFGKKAGHLLAPILKEVGPTVLKELVIPMLKAKYSGGEGIFQYKIFSL